MDRPITDSFENDQRLGLGGNNPPEPTALELANGLVLTANRWITERPRILDEEMAGRCQDFVNQLRECASTLEVEQKAAEKPHRDGLAEVAGRYRDPRELVKAAIMRLRALATVWLDAKAKAIADAKAAEEEAARRLREEAIKKTAEAAEAQMKAGANYLETQLHANDLHERADRAAKEAAKKAKPAQVHGDMSARAMSLHKFWFARFTDPVAALKHYAKQAAVREAALAAALKIAKEESKVAKDASKAPPGTEFYFESRAV